MKLRVFVCALMATARLAELAYSSRNVASAAGASEGTWSRRSYPLMVALHTSVLAGTAVAGGRTQPIWLALLAAVQPLRASVLWTLRRNWNARGVVSASTEVQTGGPYRYIRHPNYLVVIVELAALPLAFGMRTLALAASLVNAGLLVIRIREEEALLSRLSGYSSHFREKARFIPGIF